MFIDPKLAQDRLDDPSNILNSLFKQHKSYTTDPEHTVELEPESELEEIPTGTAQGSTPEDDDSAVLAMLGLNPRRELPTESAVLPYNRHGRTKAVLEMPPETQELIGTLGALGNNQQDLANQFNIDQSTVSTLAKGKRKKNPELQDRIQANIGKVVDRALEKLLTTVDSMDEHRIEQLSIKDAANVAAQMSKVVSNMHPKDSNPTITAGQLIVYAPAQFNENRYEVVELGS